MKVLHFLVSFRVPRFGAPVLSGSRLGRYFATTTKSDSKVNVLVLNAGRNNLRYGLFSISSQPSGHDWLQKDSEIIVSGSVEYGAENDKPGTVVTQIPRKTEFRYDAQGVIKDPKSALNAVKDLLTKEKNAPLNSLSDIAVVAHRVVHGGEISKAMVIDDKLLDAVRKASTLAPLHNPANIKGIEAAREELPSAVHVAVFDTAFHQTMPPESYAYALPRDLAAHHAVRRYGFHGQAYQFVLQEVADELGRRESELNLIICYIGQGASMACIERGRCVDTTMGMTPLEGLVMESRCGDIDPGAILHLANELKLDADGLDQLLNTESGLKGLCGRSDLREVEQAALIGDADAILAEKIFVERIRHHLGSFLVRLHGDVDALVFTGELGDACARMRQLVCLGLERFGFLLDSEKNWKNPVGGVREVSTPQSFSKVLVVRSHEELSMALQSVTAVAEQLPVQTSGHVPVRTAARRYRDDSEARARLGGAEGGIDGALRVVAGAAGLYMASHNVDQLTNPMVAQVGLMYTVAGRATDVGYFRPFVSHARDEKLLLMREVFHIRDEPESMYGVTMDEAADLLYRDREDVLLERIVSKYLFYKRGHEFVLVGGSDARHVPTDWPTNMDTKVAAALSLPMVWATNVASALMPGETDSSLVERIVTTANGIRPRGDLKHVPFAGIILTDVPEPKLAALKVKAAAALAQEKIHLIATVPSHPKLLVRTVRDIASALDARIMYSRSANSLDGVDVSSVIIASATVDKLLERIVKRAGMVDPIVAAALPDSLVSTFRAEFTKFVGRAGDEVHIRVKDVGQLMAAMGYSPSARWLRSVITEVDRTGSGEAPIDFQTFLRLVLHRRDDAGENAAGSGGVVAGPLVLTNAARVDILFTLLLASLSANFPRVAGVLLTDAPDEAAFSEDVLQILRGMEAVGLPVLCAPLDTFSAASRLQGPQGLPPGGMLTGSSRVKLQVIQDLFAGSTCPNFVRVMLEGKAARTEMTSYIFQHSIAIKAKATRRRVVLPEGSDGRVLEAAAELLDRDLCDVILLGDPEEVLWMAKVNNADVSRATIMDPRTADDLEEMSEALSKLRGMDKRAAVELVSLENNWYAAMLIFMGKADGVVSAANMSPTQSLRPALQILRSGDGGLVSSVLFMLLPDRVYVFGDCAVNVDPTPEQLADIAVASARSAAAIGVPPRVAMISYATGMSNTGPNVDKIRKATALAKAKDPSLLIEGPLQFDAAVHPDVAALKCKGQSVEVAGKATVCIFPDLNTGNTTSKAVHQATKCVAVGPVMQGLVLPFNVVPFAATSKDIVTTVLVTCVQAHAAREIYPGSLVPP